jgi:hypothetical protein
MIYQVGQDAEDGDTTTMETQVDEEENVDTLLNIALKE